MGFMIYLYISKRLNTSLNTTSLTQAGTVQQGMQKKIIISKTGVLLLLFSLELLVTPSAWAVQVHGPPEGLYVHQMAHVGFALSMVFLLYMLHVRPLGDCAGWKYLKISVFFFLLWNIDSMMAHALGTWLSGDAIQGSSMLNHMLVGPEDWRLVLFYITKNDHFLCVPAMIFMFMFLRIFYVEHLNNIHEVETCLHEKGKGEDTRC